MDTKIENGDIKLDEKGMPISIMGLEELKQRALICLKTSKGSFVYNRGLGFRKGLSQGSADKILLFAREALSGTGLGADALSTTDNEYIFSLKSPYGDFELSIGKEEV